MLIEKELQITDKKDLVPGQLYCCFEIRLSDSSDEEEHFDGPLVWYAADGNFYDANYDDTEGEEVSGYADFWVSQNVRINSDYT